MRSHDDSTEVGPAPPGFTPEQWDDFDRDGYLVLPEVLDEHEIEELVDAAHEVAGADPKYRADRYYGIEAIVERHPAFADLIAHPRHVGYAYDVYGEQLRLHMSQLFLRPPGGAVSEWHTDGARMVPYRTYAPRLPLAIKVGYWLTEVSPGMGCLMVIPGSHRTEMIDTYTTHDPRADEVPIAVRRGTITVMHHALWHRVEPNTSDVVRENVYVAYSPSWLQAADRVVTDPDWAASLPRAARIVMRAYQSPYEYAKPGADDVPLFLARADEPSEAGAGGRLVPDHLARHRLPVERFLDHD